jgi:predicted Zn-ribbon and HTH transcriptional regulator
MDSDKKLTIRDKCPRCNLYSLTDDEMYIENYNDVLIVPVLKCEDCDWFTIDENRINDPKFKTIVKGAINEI